MHNQSSTNIHIVCAPLPPKNMPTAIAFDEHTPTLPISWYGTLPGLERMPSDIGTTCLELDADDLCVKHRLRMKLRSARYSFPDLKVVVISNPGRDHQYDLFVDEGISVILTHSTTAISSPRRPTPAGWPCRNVQWGLWEVSRDNPKPRSTKGFFSALANKRPHCGSLRVLDTGLQNGNYDHRKFTKATRRLRHLISKKATIAISLDQLPTVISKRSSREMPASILKAA
ncbi:MAG: hypothetical protein HOK57_03495 [Planctomycetaceae bacterium]|nr:hypothetical protein [Planctomycetaceae bacterium]MBT6458867.1 hypothetical protein [Planctomycetaceae bacterium]MBT7727786.1 hypothetical protein [Planctomycetaceae bacterium]